MVAPRMVELNVPPARDERWEAYVQHLISASNELFLLESWCERHSVPVPPPLRRAHASLRSELRRRLREPAPRGTPDD